MVYDFNHLISVALNHPVGQRTLVENSMMMAFCFRRKTCACGTNNGPLILDLKSESNVE